MENKLVFTKQIKGGVLKATAMEKGASFKGTYTGSTDGQYGPVLTFDINGKPVRVFPSGNLKKNANTLNAGVVYTITRGEDVVIKGYPATQFTITAAGAQQATAVNSDIKARIDAAKKQAAGE